MARQLWFAYTHAAIQFSQDLARSELWVKSGDSLLAAAKLLEPELDRWWKRAASEPRGFEVLQGANCQAPHFLLVAFAIENFFKALLVHRRSSELKNKLLSRLPPFLRTHDLLELAAELEFPISIPEQDLCFRLSRNSLWAGRYPTPAGPRDTRAVAQLSDGKFYLAAYFSPSDTEGLRRLSSRVRDFVTTQLESAA